MGGNLNITRPGAIIIEGHVQGLSNVRALGEAGIPVYVTDKTDCLARYSRYCRKFLKCPDYDSPEFITFLIEIAECEQTDGWLLLPSNDHAVYNISKNAEVLETKFKLITPDVSIIEKIYNKEELLSCAQKCGVPIPSSWFAVSSSAAMTGDIKYPCLVKGKRGLNFYKRCGKKAFLCWTEDDLQSTIRHLERLIPSEEMFIQELIPSSDQKVISFAVFSVCGGISAAWAGIKVREHPLSFGTSTYSRSIDGTVLFPLAEKLIRELHYTGICEIEFIYDPRDRQYKLIEVNARTWLWVDLARKCGVDFALYAYNFVNKIEIQFPKEYNRDKEWIHYLTDIPYSLWGLLKGNYTVRQLAASYYKAPSPAVFRKSDFMPTLAELYLIPSMIFNR